MPYTYLPGRVYLRINGDVIELILDDEVLFTFTPDEARSNAADLIQAADMIDGRPYKPQNPPPTDEDIEQGYRDAAEAFAELDRTR